MRMAEFPFESARMIQATTCNKLKTIMDSLRPNRPAKLALVTAPKIWESKTVLAVSKNV